MKDSLQNILNDKTSGSSEILVKLNTYFQSTLNNTKAIKEAVKKSKSRLSQFEVVNDYLDSLEAILNSNDIRKLETFLHSFESNLQTKYQKLYSNSMPYLKNVNTVLTISNSKTLLEVFKLWKRDCKNLKIIVCESRPKNEGRILAKALAKEEIKTEIITDAMMSMFIPKVDAVVIGADSILRNGNVVNKTGSAAAAILCRSYKKPFYVLAAKEKMSKAKSYLPKKQDSDEVWKVKKRNLVVLNIYFEEVPAKLITKVITD